MIKTKASPLIKALIDSSNPLVEPLYSSIIQNIISNIVDFDPNDEESKEEAFKKALSMVPILCCSKTTESAPCSLNFYLLCKHRSNAFKFFYEMISRWLVPAERQRSTLLFAADFRIEKLSDETFTACEHIIQVSDEKMLQSIKDNIAALASEIRIGIASEYHARKILEVKGLFADEKTSSIQEHIDYLIKRRKKDFSYDVFSDMQRLLVLCSDRFKGQREARQLSRIISVHYLFRKQLKKDIRKSPQKRKLYLKFLKTRLKENTSEKTVLGVLIGLNFIRSNEVFQESHILKAIQNYLPQAQLIEGSFFQNKDEKEKLGTFYLEIEKENEEDFSLEEIRRLNKELPQDLADRIEQLIHTVSLPQNEEEILKNILTLSHQLKYVRDLPQVIISFEGQSDDSVTFIVILLRIMKEDSKSLKELFIPLGEQVKYFHDRSKLIGKVRKKHPKQANVFRLEISKEDFWRSDHSLDLQKARQALADTLENAIGPFRDFNGGMITKQHELFCNLKDQLKEKATFNELLLENFFYSLNPASARALLDSVALSRLFSFLLDSIHNDFFRNDKSFININEDKSYLYCISVSENLSFKDEVQEIIDSNKTKWEGLAWTHIFSDNKAYVSYLYKTDNIKQRAEFIDILKTSIEKYELV